MQRQQTLIKIHAAAYHFASVSREIQEIAAAFEVSEWAVRKWAKTPEWQKALNTFGYNGNPNFETHPKRDTTREKPKELETVRTVYLQLIDNGVPSHKLPRLVSEITGIDKRRIYEWAKRFHWRDTT